MSRAALIHQKVRFWNITPCFILKLKTMYCNHPIIIVIGGQQYLSVNYVFLLYFQMQPWKGFFSQMNSIKITLRSKLNIYSLNALLRIRIGVLIIVKGNMSKNVWIVGATPRNVDSGKAGARCPTNENQRYQSDRILIFQIFHWPLLNLIVLTVIIIK